MAVLERLKQFATGKTEIERKQEAAANQIIRQKATSAALVERQKQAVKFAEERERVIYKRKTEQLNKPKPSFMSGFNAPNRGMSNSNRDFGSMFGPQQSVSVNRPRRVKVRTKSKKKRKSPKHRYVNNNIQQPMQQPHFRVI